MLIKRGLVLTLLFVLLYPTTTIEEPKKEGELFRFSVPPIEEIDPIPEPELEKVKLKVDDSILYNCWKYVKTVFPDTPSTATILANLSDSGEIAVFYYPDVNLYHYAVVESVNPLVITETNYQSGKKTTRTNPSRLIGFYDLPDEER